MNDQKKQSPPIPGTHPAPVALVVRSDAGDQWINPVCPHCGARHVYGAIHGLLGGRLSHCINTSSRIHPDEVELVEATREQAEALKAIGRIRFPWRVIDRLGREISKHQRRDTAMNALERWAPADHWATVVNVRIDAVADLLGRGAEGAPPWGDRGVESLGPCIVRPSTKPRAK